ncbi:MAG: hypothetical protein P8177_01910, partial [Gemmatimonadota bacterium]
MLPLAGALWLVVGCTGYSASHGPRPLEPGHRTFAVGASAISDSGEQALFFMPEVSYRQGLTDGIDAGVEWAGYSLGVDALASLWEQDPTVLSAGLGVSITFPGPSLVLHPELYVGSDHLFMGARAMMVGGGFSPVPGLSFGTLLGDRDGTIV